MQLLKTAFSTALEFFFPEKCALCHCLCSTGFCTNCQELLPWLGCRCEICSAPLPEFGICGHCQVRMPEYQDSAIPFRYKAPISDCIHALKYGGKLHYARPLAKMLSLCVQRSGCTLPDVLVPVPLHRARIMRRGFNQATEIARIAGREFAIPVDCSLLKRVKNTVTQTGLNEKMRQQNMSKAFVATGSKLPRHIALVDDVVTSGNTVNSAAAALACCGVRRISIWAVAKT
jgi:ComF family protein